MNICDLHGEYLERLCPECMKLRNPQKMKLWSCSWLYPLEVNDLPQWKHKGVLIEAQSAELAEQIIQLWAENHEYHCLSLKVSLWGEFDETTGDFTRFDNLISGTTETDPGD